MPDLNFKVESVEAMPYAVAPTLAFKLRITQEPNADTAGQDPVPGRARRLPSRGPLDKSGSAGASPSHNENDAPIHSVSLRCQIRLEPGKRRYSPEEQTKLGELFGEPHRWGQTVRSMLWAHASIVVPPFSDETLIDLPVPCTFDFNVATTKYFDALADGLIPLSFLFSGTIFYAGPEDGALQIDQISWEKEAEFRLPVQVWRRMMELYYPNTAWLCLRKDIFDRLQEYRRDGAIPSWEKAIEILLDQAQERVIP